MKPLNEIIRTIIHLRETGKAQITLLAVCPNSAAVLEAAVKAAAANNTVMLFAATLNQVDTDGGYTGWTPAEFVRQMSTFAIKYNWNGLLYPCLDHGGPWLKDQHKLDNLSLDETMRRVKDSLSACLEAGYALLHIDPTVDTTLISRSNVPLRTVVDRTVELITHAETVRIARDLPPVAYEVGTEEVHGGLVDFDRFQCFLAYLREELAIGRLSNAWPCFVVAQVGTDLHTTSFDFIAARRLYYTLAPLGSLAKGHYTDWVENPENYPVAGMGGANVGPEFTAAEYQALKEMEIQEKALCCNQPGIEPSRFMKVVQSAVLDSNRWKKWLQPEEHGLNLLDLPPTRQDWLLQTGARYIWTYPAVQDARSRLYANLATVMPEPHSIVVDHITSIIDKYIKKFNLFDSLEKLI